MRSKCTRLNTQYFYILIIYIFLNQKLQPTKRKTPNFNKVSRELELKYVFCNHRKVYYITIICHLKNNNFSIYKCNILMIFHYFSFLIFKFFFFSVKMNKNYSITAVAKIINIFLNIFLMV